MSSNTITMQLLPHNTWLLCVVVANPDDVAHVLFMFSTKAVMLIAMLIDSSLVDAVALILAEWHSLK